MSRSAAAAAEMDNEWELEQLFEVLEASDHNVVSLLTLAIFEQCELEVASSHDNAHGNFVDCSDLRDLMEELPELESSMGMPEADAMLFRGCFAVTLMAYAATTSQGVWPSIAQTVLDNEDLEPGGDEGEKWIPDIEAVEGGLQVFELDLDQEQRTSMLEHYVRAIEYWK